MAGGQWPMSSNGGCAIHQVQAEQEPVFVVTVPEVGDCLPLRNNLIDCIMHLVFYLFHILGNYQRFCLRGDTFCYKKIKFGFSHGRSSCREDSERQGLHQ